MKRFFPLILAIVVGLGGYLYFNQKTISTDKINNVFIYTGDQYKSKKPSPFIKLEKNKPIKTIVNTINSSNVTSRKVNINKPNYVIDIVYDKDKKETFLLWLNENTNSAMYQDKNRLKFHIASKKCTTSLKTLIFR